MQMITSSMKYMRMHSYITCTAINFCSIIDGKSSLLYAGHVYTLLEINSYQHDCMHGSMQTCVSSLL